MKISDIWRTIRARFYITFRKRYVFESIKRRKGGCRRCGACEVVPLAFRLFYICPHYDTEKKKCKVWGNQPITCNLYPFDERDKWSFTRDKCGFYW